MKKTILITGCSSGIGYDAAHGMRAAGWRVFASCRSQADCDRLIAEGFDSPRLDYNDTTSLEAGLAEVLAATGGTLSEDWGMKKSLTAEERNELGYPKAPA